LEGGSTGHFTEAANLFASCLPADRLDTSGDMAEPDIKITRWNRSPGTREREFFYQCFYYERKYEELSSYY